MPPKRAPPKLPERIRCSGCGQTKGAWNFSTAQKETAQRSLFAGKGIGPVKCLICIEYGNSGNRVMHCVSCDQEKPKEEFAKNKRKDPDSAVCERCMIQHIHESDIAARAKPHPLVLEADPDEHDQDYEDARDDETTTNPFLSEYAITEAGFSRMSVTDAGDASTTPGNLQKTGLKNLFADEDDDEEDCDTTASNAGGIIDEERTAAAWQSITSSRTRAFGGEVNKTNSTVSTPAGNLENFVPRKSTLTASRTPMNDNPRSFAKVKAYNPIDPDLNPYLNPNRENGQIKLDKQINIPTFTMSSNIRAPDEVDEDSEED